MLRLLLVEDNAGDAEIVRHRLAALRETPWQMAQAETLEEGLALARTRQFDLIFLDLNLPDSSGLETLDVLRAEVTEGPVVVLTGTDDLDLAVEALRRGADDYISKGALTTELLRRTIRYAVERRRMLVSLEKERRTVTALQDVGAALASELNREALVQKITDLATELVGAAFGAFFHTVASSEGTTLGLSALSGAPRSAFESLGLPRATAIFGPTLRGEGPVRVDDVRLDPRYGKSGPHHGMPPGHLPVVSYLAVPIVLRNGTVSGGLFFAHGERAHFTIEHERLALGVAAWAAVATDNARLYEEAMQASRARENLLQVVSHDLRNHLNTMRLGLQILRPSIAPDGERRVATIERASRTMGRLLEDLVDIAAIEKGVLSVAPALVDARALFEDERTMLAPSVERKGLELRWVPCAEGVTVWADRERVQQVLGNLVSNAVKFTPLGGRVAVTTSSEGHWLVVAVEDTGPGIPQEEQGRVFDRFFRGSRPSGHGAGLGLAIARALVEAHGGRIWVDSEPGKGTKFSFTLLRSAPNAA